MPTWATTKLSQQTLGNPLEVREWRNMNTHSTDYEFIWPWSRVPTCYLPARYHKMKSFKTSLLRCVSQKLKGTECSSKGDGLHRSFVTVWKKGLTLKFHGHWWHQLMGLVIKDQARRLVGFEVLAPGAFVEGSFRVMQEARFEAASSSFLLKALCEVAWFVSERQEAAPARQQIKMS